MEKEFLKAAKELNVKIVDYKTYRSDMGCQVYKITLFDEDNNKHTFEDGLWIGSEKNKVDFIDLFKNEVRVNLNK